MLLRFMLSVGGSLGSGSMAGTETVVCKSKVVRKSSFAKVTENLNIAYNCVYFQ